MNATGRAGRFATVALALLLGAAAAVADPPGSGQAIPASLDKAARLTIAVRVNGQGPFDFLVDTGADRSVISRELAAVLKLPPGPHVMLHSTGDVAEEDTAIVDRLAFGTLEVRDIRAPLLSAANMGASGILGLDSLRGQQVTMDFDSRQFAIRPAPVRMAESGPFTVVVEGRRLFGQLVLVDADSQDLPILVILDSGAQNTVGNAELRRLLAAPPPPPGGARADVLSVTGSRTPARLDIIPELRLGGIMLRGVPVAYADLQTFRQFHLQGRPALLLGMDVLHLFRSVTVDFPRREAVFVAR